MNSKGYQKLAHAIVMRAISDLKEAYRLRRKCWDNELDRRLAYEQYKDVMRFLKGEWCYGLTGIDSGAMVKNVLRVMKEERLRDDDEEMSDVWQVV